MDKAHFILYVRDQVASTTFYSRTLNAEPTLNVTNMTEFALPGGAVLGLMPETAITKLLGDPLPDPASAHGTPRSELYLLITDPAAYHRRALEAGARELSPLSPRNWGHEAAYSLDPDGHVLVFARGPEN